MVSENKMYPIIQGGNHDHPVGVVTIYTSVLPELVDSTWTLLPLLSSYPYDPVGTPTTLKGFELAPLRFEDRMIGLPRRVDPVEQFLREAAEKEAEREIMRKEILLEVIESITKL